MAQTVTKDAYMAMQGKEMDPGSWFHIDQDRINQFADATGDHQFIHIDTAQAAETPFGTTIAHGFLSLSLLPHLNAEISVKPEKVAMQINYGLNKVRFINPVKVGSEVRVHNKILSIEEKKPGQLLITTEVKMEIKGEERPAFIAETLTMTMLED